jgi:hypothetical protein
MNPGNTRWQLLNILFTGNDALFQFSSVHFNNNIVTLL